MPSKCCRIQQPLCLWAGLLLLSSFDVSLVLAASNIRTELFWRHVSPVEGCEISCYLPQSGQVLVTIAGGAAVLDVHNGQQIGKLPSAEGYHATSIAHHGRYVAVAWAAQERTDPGKIGLYVVSESQGDLPDLITSFPAGPLPDMVTFSPDGRWLIAANEGEPSDDYKIDPEGSITLVDLMASRSDQITNQLLFKRFNTQRRQLRKSGVRIFGPSFSNPDGQATVAEDLEPEYVAVSADSQRAWVTLQENNAIAELDLSEPRIKTIYPLGVSPFREDRSSTGSASIGIDVSDVDGGVHIRHWPIQGLLQPDAIAAWNSGGVDYLLTVNEGDPRTYPSFNESCRIGELESSGHLLDQSLQSDLLQDETQLGRLEVSIAAGDDDGDGDLDRLHCFGTRSFSIWKSVVGQPLELVFDSGHQLEQITSREDPQRYNTDSTPESEPDVRSCVRGPEPEGVAIGQIGSRQIAAIGLERTGGVMLYDITNPTAPEFLKYLRPLHRKGIMDCAPEGLVIVPANNSPQGKPLLVVCYEKSHTVTAYALSWEE